MGWDGWIWVKSGYLCNGESGEVWRMGDLFEVGVEVIGVEIGDLGRFGVEK